MSYKSKMAGNDLNFADISTSDAVARHTAPMTIRRVMFLGLEKAHKGFVSTEETQKNGEI